MGFASKFKNIIKMNDFFYSADMLRYQNQSEYRTLTGGIISIGIIVTILIGFASMILDTLNLNTINTTLQVIKQSDPSLANLAITPQSHFMFAIEIWHLNLSQPKRYFDITFKIDYENYGYIYKSQDVPLQPCTKEHWSNFPDVLSGFDRLEVSGWLCPVIGSSYEILGKYSSFNYTQYYVTVSACTNDSSFDRPCASPQQIHNLFVEQQFLFFDFYFTNPIINPGQKQYKSYYLEDKTYAIFGENIGSESYLYFTDYTINTDYSIWPFANIVQDKGCLVENLAVNHPFPTTNNGTYIVFSMAKSGNSLVYTREVQKLSSVFSFMGGTIGAISALLFIIKIYTSLSFQISIALQIFEPKFGEKFHISMNFFNFLKFYCFKISQMIGRPFSWPTMEYVGQCQRQILHQLDIKSLLKRVIFLQYCLTYLFEDYQLDGLQLKKPRSPEQIKKIRQKCESVENEQGQSRQQLKSGNDKPSKFDESDKIENSSKSFSSEIVPNRLTMNIVGNQQIKPKSKSNVRGIMFVEMISSQSEKESDSRQKSKSKNNVFNSHKSKSRRGSYLKSLKLNAEKGNIISQKIWNQLQQQKGEEINKQIQVTQQFT